MTEQAGKPKQRRRPRGDGALYKAKTTGLWTGAVELPPDADGKRRRLVVTSKDRNKALQKFRELLRVPGFPDGFFGIMPRPPVGGPDKRRRGKTLSDYRVDPDVLPVVGPAALVA